MINKLTAHIGNFRNTKKTFLNLVETVEDCDAKLVKKAADNPAEYDNKTWKDDPIEAARRVRECWHSKMIL